jgi:hypothetical protein
MQVLVIQIAVMSMLAFGSSAIVFLPAARILNIKTLRGSLLLALLLLGVAWTLLLLFLRVEVSPV